MSSPLTYLSLFSGIGGLDLGLDRAGMTCVGQVEKDPYCQRVLAKHWPEVPRHDDVRTVTEWWASEPRPPVHVVAGGFPCQPTSYAGLGLAQSDPRWLWPEMAAIIRALRPRWVIGENVPGLHGRGLGDVLRDLRRLGYRARTGVVSACAVGAPHMRQRLFILAHTAGIGEHSWRGDRQHRAGDADQGIPAETAAGSWWSVEPDVARMAYGVPSGVDRRRALGNAVVPQVAEQIGRLITGLAHRELVITSA